MFHRELELDNIVNKLHAAHLQLYLPSGSFPADLQAEISYVSLITSRFTLPPPHPSLDLFCNHINWLGEELDL